MSNCLCCDYPLVQRLKRGTTYYFCSHCHQRMPASHGKMLVSSTQPMSLAISRSLATLALAPHSLTALVSI